MKIAIDSVKEFLASDADRVSSDISEHDKALLTCVCFVPEKEIELPEKPSPKYIAKIFYQKILDESMDIRIKQNGYIMLYYAGYWAEITEILLRRAIYLYCVSIGAETCQTSAFVQTTLAELTIQREIFYEKKIASKDGYVYLNMRSCVLRISENGKVAKLPHDKEYGFAYKLSYDYDPKATCNNFDAYFNKVLPDTQLQKICLQFLAYCLMPHLNLEKSLILLGSGSNGKSVFFNITKALFGEYNVTSYSLLSLTDETGYTRAKIEGKLVNYASEISFKANRTDYFKALISGEPIEARLPYKNPYLVKNYARMIFNANELPNTDDTTHGYFRRFIIVPFKVKIKESEKDARLAEKIIRTDLAGIFNKVLQEIPELLKNLSFENSVKVQRELANYEVDNNNVFFFIKNKPLKKDPHNEILCTELYQTYKAFCIEYGFKAFSYRAFLKHLEKKIKTKKTREGKVAYARIPI